MASSTELHTRPSPCRGRSGYHIRTCSENMQAYQHFNGFTHDKAKELLPVKTTEPLETTAGSSDGQADQNHHCRMSSGSCSSDDSRNDKSELTEILIRRRLFVDSEGKQWESPGVGTKKSESFQDAPSTPEEEISIPDEIQKVHHDCDDNEMPHTETPQSTPEVTGRRKRRSSRELQLQQATASLKGMSAEQLAAITKILSVVSACPSEDGTTPSSETSSNDSPTGAPRGRSTSEPPSCTVKFYDHDPKYPELRKKRLSGQRSITPSKVRFACEEQEPADSDDDDIPHASSSNVSIRNRRRSRGPDGFTYQVKISDEENGQTQAETEVVTSIEGEPTPLETQRIVEDSDGLFLKKAASAAAGAARGAVYGGARGAAVGVAGALFTFGLSIPLGAMVGATYQGLQGAKEGLKEQGQEAEAEGERARSAPAESRKA